MSDVLHTWGWLFLAALYLLGAVGGMILKEHWRVRQVQEAAVTSAEVRRRHRS